MTRCIVAVRACATRRRSKGSWWCAGSPSIAAACSGSTGRRRYLAWRKYSSASLPDTGMSPRPRLCLMLISHIVTALTRIVLFWRDDQFASSRRQAGMIGNRPQGDRGVEQKLQDPILCRNSRATSSLFASISSGTSKAPLARQCAALAVAPRSAPGALLVVRSGQ